MDPRNEITFESDPLYGDCYEVERERIVKASDERLLGTFHVGSTAIPDVPGKPVLDIIVVFADRDAMCNAANALTEGRYELESDSSDCIVVVRCDDDRATFLKLHTRDDKRVRNQLLFREYLRADPTARREYERIKRKAVERHPDDLEAYTRAKTDVVRSLVEQARAKGYTNRLPEFV
ncbi:GrpB family protein [Halocatena salina]|uniref:GrpB family protein n=1 Tax=Halocatena salina TaxID=2934340 RepID=A0A8U0A6B1_9EURY|nr:GrpB family protein [Halocatena salina]UPM43467.1 GrpB family protein [Halocatena salina]